MPAYVVVQIEVTDPVEYDRYKKLAAPAIERYEGRYLVRGGRTETLEGSWDPGRFVIVEFPTVERAKAWWVSEEYRVARSIRHAAARSKLLIAEGTE